ncbi:MAG: YihA family ribosome biogenesis GTP-binding protein [Campylobacteraceae bacterium]|nr:YihA family ribosome biogenesis GTP-binding protein [Campylobacteraceae bacterium]
MIKIIEASFVTSAPSIELAPPSDTMEVVFLGRSNVGKSSLINALTNRKNLAKKSSTPGKTRLINFFNILFTKDKERFNARFVDLPGFGYAKVSKQELAKWQKSLNEFIEKREAIRLFVLLVDSRHPDLEIDVGVFEHVNSIKRADQEIIQVFTKIDKLKQSELALIKKMDGIPVSVLKQKGIEKLTKEIFKTLYGEIND